MVVRTNRRLHVTRHDGRARRRAYPGRSVEPGKLCSCLGKGINIGCIDHFIAVATKPATDVLEINPENIGLLSSASWRNSKTNGYKEGNKTKTR